MLSSWMRMMIMLLFQSIRVMRFCRTVVCASSFRMIMAVMGIVVERWGMSGTRVVGFMHLTMFTWMTLILWYLVYLLCIESDNVLDFLEQLLATEEVLVFSDKATLSPQTLLVVGLHCLLIEMMKQINQHLQHNLSDNQGVQHVDYAEDILVFQLNSSWLLVEVALDLI